MRQAVIALSLLGSFVVYALTINFFEHAVMFLLFGILPGRTQPVDATYMLLIYAWSGVAVFSYTVRKVTSIIISLSRAAKTTALRPIALYFIGYWQDRLSPQLKLLK